MEEKAIVSKKIKCCPLQKINKRKCSLTVFHIIDPRWPFFNFDDFSRDELIFNFWSSSSLINRLYRSYDLILMPFFWALLNWKEVLCVKNPQWLWVHLDFPVCLTFTQGRMFIKGIASYHKICTFTSIHYIYINQRVTDVHGIKLRIYQGS